jgi:hypothetical protein
MSNEPGGLSERNRAIILFATPIVIAVAIYSLVLAGVIRALPVAGWIWIVWFVTLEGMIAVLIIRRRRA